jgi:hypothetical protein
MSVLTTQQIAALAVELLRSSLILPSTVSKVAGEDYGGTGGTITVRVPRPRAARTQVTPGALITFDPIEEIGVDLSVSHLYNAALITDEDLTLSITDFGRQVLRPQVAAIADGAEAQVATVMNALDNHPDIEFAASASPENTTATVLAIREELTKRKVPAGDRWLAVSPDIATRLLSVPTFVRADERGATNALEQAVIGQLYGLRVVESVALLEGSAVGYHRSAFVWANRAPAITEAMKATTIREDGVALRHALPFIGERISTSSIVSTFAGAEVISDASEEAPDPDAPVIIRAVRVGVAA